MSTDKPSFYDVEYELGQLEVGKPTAEARLAGYLAQFDVNEARDGG